MGNERIHLVDQVRKAAELAQPIFERNGWTWARTLPRSPNVEEIKETIFMLYNDVLEVERKRGVDKDGISASTGRLQVEMTDYGEICVTMELAKLREGEDD